MYGAQPDNTGCPIEGLLTICIDRNRGSRSICSCRMSLLRHMDGVVDV